MFSMSRISLHPEDELTGAFVITRSCSPRRFRIYISRDPRYVQWTLFSNLEDHEDLVYLLCWVMPYARAAFRETLATDSALRAIQRGLIQYLSLSRFESGSSLSPFTPTSGSLAALNSIEHEIRYWSNEANLRGELRYRNDSESPRAGASAKGYWEIVQVVLVGLVNTAKRRLGDQSFIRLPADEWRVSS